MLQAKRNIKIQRNAGLRDTVTWKAGKPLGPVDLTGCTARAHFRVAMDSPDILLALSTDDNTIELGGVDGTVTMHFPVDLPWTKAVYDVLIFMADGSIEPLMGGEATVITGVTHV